MISRLLMAAPVIQVLSATMRPLQAKRRELQEVVAQAVVLLGAAP